MITIQELLKNRGLDIDKKPARVKLVRQKDPERVDLYDKYKYDKEWFVAYQSAQWDPIFYNVDYIVTFLGEEGRLSRFIGVYKILGVQEKSDYDPDSLTDGRYIYKMEEVEKFEGFKSFEDLRERVIIDWGKSTLAWHQWINNEKEVVQIHPGLHYKQFTDYFSFILDFYELKEIISNEYADWKKTLSATKGVYLISDTKTGKLYVGSAYGANGIWGRWNEYVNTNGHGGNKTLKELMKQDENYARNFRFSILMLLPSTVTNKEAIEKEQLFKRKLGTNAFGLNNN
jgi:hypothetical protein